MNKQYNTIGTEGNYSFIGLNKAATDTLQRFEGKDMESLVCSPINQFFGKTYKAFLIKSEKSIFAGQIGFILSGLIIRDNEFKATNKTKLTAISPAQYWLILEASYKIGVKKNWERVKKENKFVDFWKIADRFAANKQKTKYL